MTIREHKKKIKGLNIAIVGDILHSRVARSNIHLLTKLGAKVRVAGPGTLVPSDFAHLIDETSENPKSETQNPKSLEVVPRIEDAIEGSDVVMILRIQRERQDSAYFPTLREYAIHYGLTNDRLALAKKDAIVLHPGPMNRGIEISSDVADSSRSLILDQVKYGVAVRMAVLYLATGGSMGRD
jgi:aspartate carbamoyltransferase catalytic subunit